MTKDYKERYAIAKERAEQAVQTFNFFVADNEILRGWGAVIEYSERGPKALLSHPQSGIYTSFVFSPQRPWDVPTPFSSILPPIPCLHKAIKTALEASSPNGPNWREDDPRWVYLRHD
jgi:hypothetical protein